MTPVIPTAPVGTYPPTPHGEFTVEEAMEDILRVTVSTVSTLTSTGLLWGRTQ